MYNANIPTQIELPSSGQLLISTLVAFMVAALLLITVIVPAEYGIDPSGVGKRLGLTKMGEIKMQLAEEARQEEARQEVAETPGTATPAPANQVAEVTEATASATPAPASEVVVVTEEQPQLNTETMSVTLEPGAAAEIKVALNKDEVVTYRWEVDTGHVNYDTHGDNDSIKYHSYNKGKARTSHEGEIIAAFDGGHGWFWRNRSNEVVTVTIKVSGDYSSIKRVL